MTEWQMTLTAPWWLWLVPLWILMGLGALVTTMVDIMAIRRRQVPFMWPALVGIAVISRLFSLLS